MKIDLTKTQIDFLRNRLDIQDSGELVQKFADLMALEHVPAKEMSKVINAIIARLKKEK